MAKYCGKCGSKLDEKTGLCPQCDDVNPKQHKSRKGIIVSIVLLIVVVVGCLIAFFVFKDNFFPKSDEELLEAGLSDYFSTNKDILNISNKFEDENGYINSNDVEKVINAVGEYAESLYNKKAIKDFEITEGYSVWIQFNSGVEYLYIPQVKDVDESAVSTYQPCLFTYNDRIAEKSKTIVDGAADSISKTLQEYSFENNFDNNDITLDGLKEIGNSQVVIWHGHGGYAKQTHSVLMTALELDETSFLLDPVYYIQNIGYTADFLTGKIVCSNSGYVMVTYKFFDEYIDSMDSSIVYLGACCSGEDDTLANVFISKGADAVLANTDIIHTEYNLEMIKAVFESLLSASPENRYNNLKEALETAKSKNGKVCCEEHKNTKVAIWGNGDQKLSEQEIKYEKSYTVDSNKEYVSDYIQECDDDVFYSSSDGAHSIMNLPVLDFSNCKPDYIKIPVSSDGGIQKFIVYGKSIYYICNYHIDSNNNGLFDQGSLYKCDLDGSNKTEISDNVAYNYFTIKDYILTYYNNKTMGKTNGAERCEYDINKETSSEIEEIKYLSNIPEDVFRYKNGDSSFVELDGGYYYWDHASEEEKINGQIANIFYYRKDISSGKTERIGYSFSQSGGR